MAIKKNFKHLLINKQWIKHFYGGLKNNTFKSFFFLNKPFVSVIESRLDLAIFRTNLLTNVLTIRSLIAHRKIKLNNKIVTRPSLQLKQGDIVNISTFGKFKINRFVPLYLETSYKLRTFTFLKVLEENLKFFLLFIFKDLHFYKTYNYFISHKKS
jgi:ribosomal protein S4